MSWRFLATRLDGIGGESLIDPDLPLSGVQLRHALSGTSSLKAKIPHDVRRLVGADGAPVFVPWSTAIYAEKDGEIRLGAILTDMDSDGESLSLQCDGFTAYLKDIPFTEAFVGYHLDPMRVAVMLWNHAQKAKQGNLGLVVSINESPVRIGKRGHPALRGRPNIYNAAGELVLAAQEAVPAQKDEPFVLAWYQTSDLHKVFSDLSELTPFDYVEKHDWMDVDGCQILHTLDLKHPIISRKRDDLRFVLGENVIAPPRIQEDGEDFASEILALGAGEGSEMTQATVADHQQGRLRRVSLLTKKDVSDKITLATHARNELRYRSGAVSFDELYVIDSPLARYGDLQVGDVIYVQPGKGWYENIDQWVRVLEISVSPDADDNMRLIVTAISSD